MIRYLLSAVALLCIIPFSVRGQFYTTGENPSRIKWQQISSDNFKIIYPAGLSNEAVKMASALEYALRNADDFSYKPVNRFPVLLQNASVLSNGFVALAPSRMETQITPPQDSYAQDWIGQLSLHEFRHISQIKNLNQGITGLLGNILGDIPRGLVSAQVPSWFYEGDAVYNETRLSQTGRGRSAGFDMTLRTLLKDTIYRYSYDKAIFGSYRDFVPDQYVYGYKMTEYVRTHYGTGTWSSVIDHVARNPYKIWPFALYLNKKFGFFNRGLYTRTIDSLKVAYNGENDVISKEGHFITKRNTTQYTSYIHPRLYNDKVVAYRTGVSDPGSFVLIDSTGNERRILNTGRALPGKADLNGNSLIWDEIRTDPRWGKRDYSVIMKAEITTGKVQKLTHKTRFFSPDFSPDGSRIAVAENDPANRNFLTILDAGNGKVIQRIFTGSKAVVTPEWTDDNTIVVITVSKSGKQLESVNVANEQWTVLIPYTTNNIYEPAALGNFILFRADYDQTENLFALDKYSGNVFQVTESNSGVRHPEVTDDLAYIYFSEYTVQGFSIKKIKTDRGSWNLRNPATGSSSQDTMVNIRDVPTTLPETYNKSAHFFRFHSWIPFYADMDEIREDFFNSKIYPGFILLSQNMLGTSISSLGYRIENGYHHFTPRVIWRGLYPVFNISMDIGGPHRILPIPEDVAVPDIEGPYIQFNARTYVPLTFSRGAFTTFLRPELEYEFSRMMHYSAGRVRNGVGLMHLRFFASNFRRMAIRDIYPRWGQSISSAYTFQPGGSLFGQLYSIRLTMFFPGMLKHHNLFFAAGHQSQKEGSFLLPYIRTGYPRGYTHRLAKTFSCLMLNYALPLLYPDISLGPVMYIKRIRSNFFYDAGVEGGGLFGLSEAGNRSYIESLGTEITADLHAFRFIFPVSAGIRIGYRTADKISFAEFLLQVNTDF